MIGTILLPKRSPRLTSLLLCLVALTGCGGDGRLGLSGSVTVDGQPLDSGVISFTPAAGTEANSAGTGIEGGRYRIPAEKGLIPGAYRVRIQAYEPTGRMVEDPQFGTAPETVMLRFTETESLRAVVASDGPNRFDFALSRAVRPGPPR